jgi:thymidine phosphorylase
MQIVRLSKAKAAHVGADLKFSSVQHSHHLKHMGGGIGDALRSLAGHAINAATPLAVSLADRGLSHVGSALTERTKKYLPEFAQDAVEHGVQLGKNYTAKQLQGVLQGLASTARGRGLFAPGTV